MNSSLMEASDTTGWAEFALRPGNYLLLGTYEGIPVGRNLGEFAADEIDTQYIQTIEKCDKKKSPAKNKIIKGSEIMVIEPEYVEWSEESQSELYPFIFESVGEWSVTTSVDPPEGFVTEQDTLSEEVNNELEAIQFTITDVGTQWKKTKVKHKFKHKGKTKNFDSEIGIKLTPGKAKKLGISEWGEDWPKEKK